jgi:quercetin dioxygenase-like cupin family protein
MKGYQNGNAADRKKEDDGWFLGSFLGDVAGLRKTDNLEIKWDTVPAGKKRGKWGLNERATSLTLLIKGQFRIRFKDGEVLLSKEGDYAIWGPGEAHNWEAEKDSVTLTIRWPSAPGFARDLERVD